MATDVLPEAWSMIEIGVEAGHIFHGAQIYVSIEGECVADEAMGLARPAREATTDTIFPVWCTTKPLNFLAILHLCDQGAFELDRTLGSYGPALRDSPIGSVTPRGVITHRGGVPSHWPMPGVFPTVEAAIEGLRELELDPAPDGVRYSASWGFLAISVALREQGIQLEDVIREQVLDPLGISDLWLPIGPENLERDGHRLGTNWAQIRDVLRPYPGEGLEVDAYPDFGLGGYASARALGTFYEALLDRRVVESGVVSEATYEAMLTPSGPPGHDPMMQRECNYGLGFMIDLSHHGFGEGCSASSFGHSGGTGYMFAFADPADDLVVAGIFPSLEAGNLLMIASRRPHLIDTIRRDLGLM